MRLKGVLGLSLLSPVLAYAQTLELGDSTWLGQNSPTQGVEAFYGIPFAKPPVDELRWQAPQPVSYDKGEFSAQQFGAACVQTEYTTVWYKDLLKAFEGDLNKAATPTAISEDCLYLNIWKPAKVKEPLPIMVFVHGGNNLGGWGYEPNYLGDKLAKKDVIVISINYRMGVFGFFAHPKLTEQGAGNQGLLDIVESLKWVQKYAPNFGGDANNVTLFGESAGSANIGHLSISPLTKGLFHRAIRQSGAFEIDQLDNIEEEAKFGKAYAESLGAKSLEAAKALDASKLVDTFDAFYRGTNSSSTMQSFYGAKDDYLLPRIGLEAHKESHIKSLMIGFNKDESLMYVSEGVKAPNVDKRLGEFLALHNETPRQQQAMYQDGLYFACPTIRTAKTYAENGVDTYVYLFDRQREGAGGERLKVYHGAELPYVFNQHDDWLPTTKTDTAISESMLDMWANFAKGRAPANDWVTATSKDIGMRIGSELTAGIEPFGELCELLDAADQP